MATEYKKAPEVKAIADDLIEQYHRHLMGLPVYYVFHAQAKEKKGRTVLATASKQTGIMALLVRQMLPQHDFGDAKDAEFFLIDVAHDAWEKLTEIQRIALVDHELSHCILDDKENLSIVGHDVEEFALIVRKYGAWKPDLKHFARMLKEGEQMSFDDMEEDEESPGEVSAFLSRQRAAEMGATEADVLPLRRAIRERRAKATGKDAEAA